MTRPIDVRPGWGGCLLARTHLAKREKRGNRSPPYPRPPGMGGTCEYKGTRGGGLLKLSMVWLIWNGYGTGADASGTVWHGRRRTHAAQGGRNGNMWFRVPGADTWDGDRRRGGGLLKLSMVWLRRYLCVRLRRARPAREHTHLYTREGGGSVDGA